MSRYILFRGKTLSNGEWVEGYYFMDARGDAFIIPTHFLAHREHDTEDMFWQVNYLIEVDPSTVGQATGLKDKNEKMVFEGDILKCWKSSTFDEDENGNYTDGYGHAEVEWLGSGFNMKQRDGEPWFFHGPEGREFIPEDCRPERQDFEWMEVIGTIHNKEAKDERTL